MKIEISQIVTEDATIHDFRTIKSSNLFIQKIRYVSVPTDMSNQKISVIIWKLKRFVFWKKQVILMTEWLLLWIPK